MLFLRLSLCISNISDIAVYSLLKLSVSPTVPPPLSICSRAKANTLTITRPDPVMESQSGTSPITWP